MKWIETRVQTWLTELQRHAQSWWYAPLIAILAAVDHFVIVVPTDGLTISAALMHPRRWVRIFIMVAIGSTLGATVLAWGIEAHGLPILVKLIPGLVESGIWKWTEGFMAEYGALALLCIMMSPLMQHPAIALAALANMPLFKIFGIILVGRLIKYGIMCWIASHAPHLIRRLWGVRKEVREVVEATPPSLPGVTVLKEADAQIATRLDLEDERKNRHSL